MKKQIALKTIFGISVVGVLFSGTLSYQEIFSGTCSLGGCSMLGSLPTCVYGLIMYLAVLIISYLGLKSKK
ncbi:hypothetical protein ISS08_01505 [Candidatus Pacearchaeota archaeon]|nr:hypothetical protein [Candidatus Pacearchaeota archaeon]